MSEQQGWVTAPSQHAPAQQSWAGSSASQPWTEGPTYQSRSDIPPYRSEFAAARDPYGAAQPTYGPTPPTYGAPVRRRRRLGTALAAIVAAVLLSGASAVAGGYAALTLQPVQNQAAPVRGTTVGAVEGSLADVASAVLPAVVTITAGNGAGSGVVISTDGTILTNNHVIASARGSAVQVTFSDGKTTRGQVVGAEPKNDLAVVKVAGVSGLTALAFGDSDAVRVGDTVLAMGSPLGLDGSVTAGIVSAVNRTIQEGSSRNGAATSIEGAIQTDAAINPGNSGGALVNGAGQLIGINTAIATSGAGSGNIGVGFAISSNTARTVAQRLVGS